MLMIRVSNADDDLVSRKEIHHLLAGTGSRSL